MCLLLKLAGIFLMKNIFFTWGLFLLISCNTLSLLNAGVKSPKAESIEEPKEIFSKASSWMTG
jgi:hypothetical protein